MSTSFEKIIAKFFRKIEKDRDFFAYYNVDFSEAMSLAREQANWVFKVSNLKRNAKSYI